MRNLPYLSSLLIFITFPAWGVETGFLDKGISPCQDFYHFACGGWLKSTELPADRPYWSRGFTALDAKIEELLIGVLEDYRKGKYSPANPHAAQMGKLYGACLDEKAISARANREFIDIVDPILRWPRDKRRVGEELGALVGSLQLKGVDAFFGFSFDQDYLDPSVNLMVADQGGLGLPTREYYFSEDPATVVVRKAYRDFIEDSLKYRGLTAEESGDLAGKVFAFETELARAALEPADRRNPLPLYHRLERKGLRELAPNFSWAAYWKALGTATNDKINVAVPAYFTAFNKVVADTPLDVIRAYLIARTFAAVGDALDAPAAAVHFKYLAALRGLKEPPKRNIRCLREVSSQMGMALGKAYVDLTFGDDAKRLANTMVEKLKAQMKKRLDAAAWMDGATRKAALQKLALQKVYMGFPDKWRSYTGLKVSAHSMLQNRLEATAYNRRYEFSQLDKPHDRSEWTVSPAVVNAINTVTQNKLNFPAGILQPPNFGKSLALVENYGAMGTIVGHEITHGYDDTGRRFDERGALRDWWTTETSAQFEKRQACIVKQYDGFKLDSGQKLNGRLAQGEAAADLGGLKLAYAAWKAQAGESAGKMDESGFTQEQRFFLALAQAWCEKATPEFENMVVRSDPHSPARFRVNATVSQVPEFGRAFQCETGAPMAPSERCEVW